MQPPLSFQYHPKQLEHPGLDLPTDQDFVVWWYGALTANSHQSHIPRVVVWFRRLIDKNTLGGFLRYDLALNFLGQFRIGSIWRNRVSTRQLRFSTTSVQVNYKKEDWLNTTSVASHWEKADNFLISPDHYDLVYRKADRSRLLQFDAGQKKVLIPCIEYFVRCYGRRQEVNRILCTYSWPEVVQRLHLEHPVEPVTNAWSISLPDLASEDDGHLLANLRYNHYTQLQVRAIQASIDKEFAGKGKNAPIFPIIGPWFEGQATLEVEGINLGNDKFLGLRVVGYTVPSEPQIISAREHSPPSGTADGEGKDRHGYNIAHRKSRSVPDGETSQATDKQARDYYSEIVDFADPSIRLLGTPAAIKMVKGKPRERTRPSGTVSPSTTVSAPGDPGGGTKGIGEAQFTSTVELDSHGAVKDLWDGLQFLKETNPELLLNIGWYCATSCKFNEQNRSYAYIELPELNEGKESIENRKSRLWLKMANSNKRRGILLIQVRSKEIVGYILELQRESKLTTTDSGNQEQTEDSFRGLTIIPSNHISLTKWLPSIFKEIIRHEGKMKKIHLPEGLHSKAYKRSTARGIHLAGVATARLALEKLGIDLSLTSIRPKQE